MSNPAQTVTGLRFNRLLSDESTHPFDAVSWELREASSRMQRGNSVFTQNVEVPSAGRKPRRTSWRRSLHGQVGTERRESGVRVLISRVVTTITSWGIRQLLPVSQDAKVFEHELTALLVGQ